MNADHSVFVAHNDYGKTGFEAVVDLAHSRKQIIANIISGAIGFTDVFRIDEYNVAEGWARDVTAEIMAEVEAARDIAELERHDPVAARWDYLRDLCKHEVA